jgi:hypothetical protein
MPLRRVKNDARMGSVESVETGCVLQTIYSKLRSLVAAKSIFVQIVCWRSSFFQSLILIVNRSCDFAASDSETDVRKHVILEQQRQRTVRKLPP